MDTIPKVQGQPASTTVVNAPPKDVSISEMDSYMYSATNHAPHPASCNIIFLWVDLEGEPICYMVIILIPDQEVSTIAYCSQRRDGTAHSH